MTRKPALTHLIRMAPLSPTRAVSPKESDMKTLAAVWILAVALTRDGPVTRTEVGSCEALHVWTLKALAWKERSGVGPNQVIAVCWWQDEPLRKT
jgi:hypothetical protein